MEHKSFNEYLQDFPILQTKMNGRPIVYLDNGATTQKPAAVIKAVADYCTYYNANPHRGAYELSVKATDIYETHVCARRNSLVRRGRRRLSLRRMRRRR